MRTVFPLLVAVLSLGAVSEAYAQLVVSPPILGQGLKPAKDIIIDSINRELATTTAPRIQPDKYTEVKLQQCKNKMSCLSGVAGPAGAKHVLHVILARRGQKVLAQFTLLDVATVKPVETVRIGCGLGLTDIENAVGGAAKKIAKALNGIEIYQRPVATAPTIRPQPTPPVAVAQPAARPATTVTTQPNLQPQPAQPLPAGVRIEASVPMEVGPNYLGWTVTGLGLATLLASGVTYIFVLMDQIELEDIPQVEYGRRTEVIEAARQKQLISLSLLVGGGAVTALGAAFVATGIGASSYPIQAPATAGGTVGGFKFHW